MLHDLVANGRKIAGGAQRRTRNGLLHQGSIRLDATDPGALAAWRDRLHHELPIALGEHRVERELTPENLARAHALEAARYATATWTDRF